MSTEKRFASLAVFFLLLSGCPFLTTPQEAERDFPPLDPQPNDNSSGVPDRPDVFSTFLSSDVSELPFVGARVILTATASQDADFCWLVPGDTSPIQMDGRESGTSASVVDCDLGRRTSRRVYVLSRAPTEAEGEFGTLLVDIFELRFSDAEPNRLVRFGDPTREEVRLRLRLPSPALAVGIKNAPSLVVRKSPPEALTAIASIVGGTRLPATSSDSCKEFYSDDPAERLRITQAVGSNPPYCVRWSLDLSGLRPTDSSPTAELGYRPLRPGTEQGEIESEIGFTLPGDHEGVAVLIVSVRDAVGATISATQLILLSPESPLNLVASIDSPNLRPGENTDVTALATGGTPPYDFKVALRGEADAAEGELSKTGGSSATGSFAVRYDAPLEDGHGVSEVIELTVTDKAETQAKASVSVSVRSDFELAVSAQPSSIQLSESSVIDVEVVGDFDSGQPSSGSLYTYKATVAPGKGLFSNGATSQTKASNAPSVTFNYTAPSISTSAVITVEVTHASGRTISRSTTVLVSSTAFCGPLVDANREAVHESPPAPCIRDGVSTSLLIAALDFDADAGTDGQTFFWLDLNDLLADESISVTPSETEVLADKVPYGVPARAFAQIEFGGAAWAVLKDRFGSGVVISVLENLIMVEDECRGRTVALPSFVMDIGIADESGVCPE